MTLADRLVVMHRGRIQQDASAQECYERPANRFVAGFIGTPPMNLVDGGLRDGRFHANGASLALGARHAAAGTRPCALGFRPDRVALGAPEQPGQPGQPEAVRATIAAVERLGDRTDVALDSPWGRLVARLDADRARHLREGESTGIAFDPAHAHLFEPGECGARIG